MRTNSETETNELIAGSGTDFTFGIEEELFLVDPETRDVIPDPAIR